MRRLLPSCLVAFVCAILPLTPAARSASGPGAVADPPVFDTRGSAPEVQVLTEAERQALRAAEQASDPDLQHQRGGHLLVAVLLIVIIVLLVT